MARSSRALRCRTVRFAALSALLLLAAGPAGAAELHRAEKLEAAPEPSRPFYGWQNIVVGYTGQLLLIHGWSSDSPILMVVGGATYAFGGMVVHAAHGNGTAAALSPLITLGAPLLMFIATDSLKDDSVGAAMALYILAAPVLDGLLGREPAKQSFAVSPALRRDHLGLSFTGAF